MNCDFMDDYAFSKASESSWKVVFFKQLPKIYDLVIIEDTPTQKKGIDAYMFSFGEKPVLKVDFKSRRMKDHHYYQKYKDRIIETMGNPSTGNLGSSIFVSKADVWAIGFFNGEEILDYIVFKTEPIKQLVKDLLSTGDLKEISNKLTNGLYASKYVKFLDSFFPVNSILFQSRE